MSEVKIKIGEKTGKEESWTKYNRIEKEAEGSHKIKAPANRFELQWQKVT